MSRQRSDYPGSRWDKFFRWLHGEYDPFAGTLEMKRQIGRASCRERVWYLV